MSSPVIIMSPAYVDNALTAIMIVTMIVQGDLDCSEHCVCILIFLCILVLLVIGLVRPDISAGTYTASHKALCVIHCLATRDYLVEGIK